MIMRACKIFKNVHSLSLLRRNAPTRQVHGRRSFCSLVFFEEDFDTSKKKLTTREEMQTKLPQLKAYEKNVLAALLILQAESLLENHKLSETIYSHTVDCLNYLKQTFPYWQSELPTHTQMLISATKLDNPHMELRNFIKKVVFTSQKEANFIQACMSCEEKEFAFEYMRRLRNKSRQDEGLHQGLALRDKRIYEQLINHFHQKRSLSEINVLLTWMHQDALQPSPLAYKQFLMCFSECNCTDTVMINNVVDKIDSEMADLTQVLHLCENKNEFRLVSLSLLMARPNILDVIKQVLASKNFDHTASDTAASASFSTGQIKSSPSSKNRLDESLAQSMKTQFKWELDDKVEVVPIVTTHKKSTQKPEISNKKYISSLKIHWRNALEKAFHGSLNHLQEKHRAYECTVYPFLKLLTPHEYVDIMLKAIDKFLTESSVQFMTSQVVQCYLGQAVERAVILKQFKSDRMDQQLLQAYEAFLCHTRSTQVNPLQLGQEWTNFSDLPNKFKEFDDQRIPWSYYTQTLVGKHLMTLIMSYVRVTLLKDMPNPSKGVYEKAEPLFTEMMMHYASESTKHIIIHEDFLQRFAAQRSLCFSASEMPMLCPPVPWAFHHEGGYITSRLFHHRMIRELPTEGFDLISHKVLKQSHESSVILNAINCLNSVPWKVNATVLKLARAVLEGGGNRKLAIPPPESSLPQAAVMSKNLELKEYISRKRQNKSITKLRYETRSLWLTELYRLSIAESLGGKTFWLPHNLDFRGRAYPIPPHLSHMGGDLSRGFLKFGQGKPLGPKGLNWLLIHLVNLTGLKKRASLEERLKYANDNMAEIIDSVERPLDGRRWWQNDEYPWQTMACCEEIYHALRHPGGPETFVSHLPVHQDGSCNGLQHYAALGRDMDGAKSVNLTNQPVPQDVYDDVCQLVEAQRRCDAAKGVEIAQKLEGFVVRKVIKQSVMTTVYGVTAYGAREQIARKLADFDNFPTQYMGAASAYLAKHSLACVKHIFRASSEIQNWFEQIAACITRYRGCHMEWETPLGLPVVQPYAVYTRIEKKRHIGRMHLFNLSKHSPNSRKQSSAMPPNFIHGLDASHMMLTALKCTQMGLTFAAVHDSFWTHACDVDTLNQICREQFIHLHSMQIMESLSDYVSRVFGFSERELAEMSESQRVNAESANKIMKTIPMKGKFDVSEVMRSTYFFS